MRLGTKLLSLAALANRQLRMPPARHVAAFAVYFLAAIAMSAAEAQQPQRLSAWLLLNAKSDSYFAGVSWQVPGEEPAQQVLKADVLQALAATSAPGALRDWISSLPVTGRVPVVFADPRWLMSHPTRDPVLLPGHKVVLPARPTTVTVVTENGDQCSVAHSGNREAKAYVETCAPS